MTKIHFNNGRKGVSPSIEKSNSLIMARKAAFITTRVDSFEQEDYEACMGEFSKKFVQFFIYMVHTISKIQYQKMEIFNPFPIVVTLLCRCRGRGGIICHFQSRIFRTVSLYFIFFIRVS